MTSTISTQAIVAIAAAVFMFAPADLASAQGGRATGTGRTGGQTGGTGQPGGMGQAGGAGQTVGAGAGAQAIGGNAPSSAVTGQVGRSADRMLQDVGIANAMGGGGLGGLGGGRGFGGFGGLSPFGANPFGTNNSASTKPSIRTRLVNGVEPASTAYQGATIVRSQRLFSAAPVSKIVNGYSIAIIDGVATVSGVARTAKDRRMAELVLKLEPGVNKVENRIVVSP